MFFKCIKETLRPQEQSSKIKEDKRRRDLKKQNKTPHQPGSDEISHVTTTYSNLSTNAPKGTN